MKKFICLLLVMLFLPVFSFADDPDPIVGFWYTLIDVDDIPEKNRQRLLEYPFSTGIQFEILILRFTENGEIYRTVSDFFEHRSESYDGAIVGTWTKDENSEYHTVLTSKFEKAYFLGEKLVVYYGNRNFALRPMQKLDLTTDVMN